MNKRTILIATLVAGGLYVAKYMNFAKSLSFSVKKVTAKWKFPYDKIILNLFIDCNNPTPTEATLIGGNGTLFWDAGGKDVLIGDISILGSKIVKGKSQIITNVALQTEKLMDILSLTFSASKISTMLRTIANLKFKSKLSFSTNLGTFEDTSSWKIKEFV